MKSLTIYMEIVVMQNGKMQYGVRIGKPDKNNPSVKYDYPWRKATRKNASQALKEALKILLK